MGTGEEVADAEQDGGFAKDVGPAVDLCVVGHHTLAHGAVGGEELTGSHQEGSTRVGALVGRTLWHSARTAVARKDG
jgi:hypothetical protein